MCKFCVAHLLCPWCRSIRCYNCALPASSVEIMKCDLLIRVLMTVTYVLCVVVVVLEFVSSRMLILRIFSWNWKVISSGFTISVGRFWPFVLCICQCLLWMLSMLLHFHCFFVLCVIIFLLFVELVFAVVLIEIAEMIVNRSFTTLSNLVTGFIMNLLRFYFLVTLNIDRVH